MDVTVDNEDAFDATLLAQALRRDRDVVENAVSRATLRAGMMRAAGHVAGKAVFQRKAGGQQRPRS